MWKEKSFKIPKNNIVKTPTGNEKSVYSMKIKKNINFSLNSGISYTEYDKIEKKVKVPLLPLSFSKTTFREVTSTSTAADTAGEIARRKEAFRKALLKKNAEVTDIAEEITDKGSHLSVKLTAQCLMRIDKEVPINTEVDNGENI